MIGAAILETGDWSGTRGSNLTVRGATTAGIGAPLESTSVDGAVVIAGKLVDVVKTSAPDPTFPMFPFTGPDANTATPSAGNGGGGSADCDIVLGVQVTVLVTPDTLILEGAFSIGLHGAAPPKGEAELGANAELDSPAIPGPAASTVPTAPPKVGIGNGTCTPPRL